MSSMISRVFACAALLATLGSSRARAQTELDLLRAELPDGVAVIELRSDGETLSVRLIDHERVATRGVSDVDDVAGAAENYLRMLRARPGAGAPAAVFVVLRSPAAAVKCNVPPVE